ncbi:MAG: serine hydrolase [Acidobacteriota bacterium]|nr:serine hydrolase [Acidobacteriota bacterium]
MKNSISKFLQSRIDAQDFPSAVYLVAEKGEIVCQDALGFAVVEPEKIEAKLDTIYDLASLTKPLVTGLLCAKLIEDKNLDLEQMVEAYLPELIKFGVSSEKDSLEIDYVDYDCLDVSILDLLIHYSAYQAWKPFYLLLDKQNKDKRKEVLNLIANKISAQFEPPVVYSDLNFIMLGGLLEKIYGKRLDKIAKEEIFAPLNLHNTFFNPLKELQKQIAASEKGNEYEKNVCREMGFEIPNPQSQIRNRIIWGEVHDGNCYFMNGVSGHAGLFSTAEETFKIAQQFLANQTTLLKPETCKLFRTNFTKGLNEARSIAFQLAETKDSTAGEALAKDSFGHLGFTGTSLWIEPETERTFILLTNRTHARRLPFANINAVRRKFHELAAEMLNAKR